MPPKRKIDRSRSKKAKRSAVSLSSEGPRPNDDDNLIAASVEGKRVANSSPPAPPQIIPETPKQPPRVLRSATPKSEVSSPLADSQPSPKQAGKGRVSTADEPCEKQEDSSPKEPDAHADEPGSSSKEMVAVQGSDNVASSTTEVSGAPVKESPSPVKEVSSSGKKKVGAQPAVQLSPPPSTPVRVSQTLPAMTPTKAATNEAAIELMQSDDEGQDCDNKPKSFVLMTVTIDEIIYTSPCAFSVDVPGDTYEIVTKPPAGSPVRNRSKMSCTSFQGKHVKALCFHYARPDSTSTPNTRSTHPAAQEICFLSAVFPLPTLAYP
jgi:hypothetical protein